MLGCVPGMTRHRQDAHDFESKWHPQVAFRTFLAPPDCLLTQGHSPPSTVGLPGVSRSQNEALRVLPGHGVLCGCSPCIPRNASHQRPAVTIRKVFLGMSLRVSLVPFHAPLLGSSTPSSLCFHGSRVTPGEASLLALALLPLMEPQSPEAMAQGLPW